jgi:hypothetical protein
MKRNLAVLMFFLPIFFFPRSVSSSSDLGVNIPRISDPIFSILGSVVEVSFGYVDVAGSIKDARIYLIVSVPINQRMDRLEPFQYVLGGWKGFFWSAEDNRKLTSGKITAKLTLPWYTGINQNTNINGFGLAVADARKFISRPHFIQGEIVRETWLERIGRLIKEALT